MPPPIINSMMENKLYNVFRQIAPFYEILLFSHTMSSGSGARSTEILSPLT